MLRKSDCAANLDPSPRLVSWWPARMLPPQSLRAEPIFSLALNLTRIVVVMFFTTFSPWGYVERLRGRGPVQSSLAAARSVEGFLRHAHLFYAILTWSTPGLSSNTQQGVFVQPFQISKNTGPHTEKARMTFETDLHNTRDLVQIPHCSEALFLLRSRHSQLLCNQNKQWYKGQLTGW